MIGRSGFCWFTRQTWTSWITGKVDTLHPPLDESILYQQVPTFPFLFQLSSTTYICFQGIPGNAGEGGDAGLEGAKVTTIVY